MESINSWKSNNENKQDIQIRHVIKSREKILLPTRLNFFIFWEIILARHFRQSFFIVFWNKILEKFFDRFGNKYVCKSILNPLKEFTYKEYIFSNDSCFKIKFENLCDFIYCYKI